MISYRIKSYHTSNKIKLNQNNNVYMADWTKHGKCNNFSERKSKNITHKM